MQVNNLDTDDLNFPTDWQIPQTNPDPQPKQTANDRFWLGVGRWSEISLYFGIGLSASLLIRLLPSLVAAGVILSSGAIAICTLLAMTTADEQERLAYQLGLAAAATAIVAGYWDALIALLQAALLWFQLNVWWVAATVALVITLEVVRGKR
jgi:hypothetical protein